MIVIHLIFRVVVIFFGLALLLFGVWDLVTPRARLVNSNPPAGVLIAAPPSAVILNFSNKLARESTMDVTSTIRLLPSGEKDYLDGSSVVIKSGIDPGDPGGKSMRADLRPGLHKGLYWVTWRTTSAEWRSITYGKTYFTVGMPVPEDTTRDMDGAFSICDGLSLKGNLIVTSQRSRGCYSADEFEEVFFSAKWKVCARSLPPPQRSCPAGDPGPLPVLIIARFCIKSP